MVGCAPDHVVPPSPEVEVTRPWTGSPDAPVCCAPKNTRRPPPSSSIAGWLTPTKRAAIALDAPSRPFGATVRCRRSAVVAPCCGQATWRRPSGVRSRLVCSVLPLSGPLIASQRPGAPAFATQGSRASTPIAVATIDATLALPRDPEGVSSRISRIDATTTPQLASP